MISVFTRRQDPLRRRQTEAGADKRCRCPAAAAAAGDSCQRFARARADRPLGRSPTTDQLVRATVRLFRYGGGYCTSFERSTCDVTIGIKSAATNTVVNRRNTTLVGGRANRDVLSHQRQWQQQPPLPRRAPDRRALARGNASRAHCQSRSAHLCFITLSPRRSRPVLRRFSELTT
jgi:hypothetical protein